MLKLIQTHFFLALLILAPASAFSESSVADFLLKSENDAKAFLVDEKDAQFHPLDSWINDAEFRWSIDGGLGKKRNGTAYEIRLKPKLHGQHSAEKKILALRLEQQENTYEQALSSALYQRYRRLLDLVEKKNKTRYFLQSVDLMRQEAKFYRDLAQSKDFQARKLLDAELSLEKATDLANLNLRQINFIQKNLGFPKDTSTSLLAPEAMSWLILFSEIEKNMNQSIPLLESPDILGSRLDLKLEKSFNQSRKAQQKIGIDLLTFEYKENRGRDDVAFTVGINLPIGDRFSTSESLHDIREAQSRLVSRMASTERAIEDQRDQIHSLSAERDLLQDRIQKIKARMKQPYAMNDPELLFTLKHEEISQARELAEIKSKAMKVYLDFLSLSGIIGKQPLRNWLQKNHPPLLGS